MTKQQIEKEFKKIDCELRINKPASILYPSDVIKRRKFLLFVQVYLSNILDAKPKEDRWYKKFETETCNRVMEFY